MPSHSPGQLPSAAAPAHAQRGCSAQLGWPGLQGGSPRAPYTQAHAEAGPAAQQAVAAGAQQRQQRPVAMMPGTGSITCCWSIHFDGNQGKQCNLKVRLGAERLCHKQKTVLTPTSSADGTASCAWSGKAGERCTRQQTCSGSTSRSTAGGGTVGSSAGSNLGWTHIQARALRTDLGGLTAQLQPKQRLHELTPVQGCCWGLPQQQARHGTQLGTSPAGNGL